MPLLPVWHLKLGWYIWDVVMWRVVFLACLWHPTLELGLQSRDGSRVQSKQSCTSVLGNNYFRFLVWSLRMCLKLNNQKLKENNIWQVIIDPTPVLWRLFPNCNLSQITNYFCLKSDPLPYNITVSKLLSLTWILFDFHVSNILCNTRRPQSILHLDEESCAIILLICSKRCKSEWGILNFIA